MLDGVAIRFLTARRSQRGHVHRRAPDTLVDSTQACAAGKKVLMDAERSWACVASWRTGEPARAASAPSSSRRVLNRRVDLHAIDATSLLDNVAVPEDARSPATAVHDRVHPTHDDAIAAREEQGTRTTHLAVVEPEGRDRQRVARLENHVEVRRRHLLNVDLRLAGQRVRVGEGRHGPMR